MHRIRISQDDTYAGTGRLVRRDGAAVIEDCWAILGPRHLEGEAAQDYAERVYGAIEEAIDRGEDSLDLDGITYSWEVEAPTIEVLETSYEFPTNDDAEDFSEWEWYGAVEVKVGDVTYEVGCVIGVPEYLRGTARAAGGDMVTPYLTAWWGDASDYMDAPGDDGSTLDEDVADDVIGAIMGAAPRLWGEVRS